VQLAAADADADAVAVSARLEGVRKAARAARQLLRAARAAPL
jgi:hypothetical protein